MSMVHRSGGIEGVAGGAHTTVAASDTIATGLERVTRVFVSMGSDPVAGVSSCTAEPAGTPGSITIKTWKATATADTAVVAATTFSKTVYWLAFGE